MNNAPARFITVAILFATVGMFFGIWMGVTENFDFRDVHAHIGLVGWATLAIFGLTYRAYPAMAESRLTAAHFWVAVAGALVMFPGIALVIAAGNPALAVAGALLTLASMVIFLVNFLRHRGS